MIGLVTAIIGDVAGHLGCFIFLKDSVNAIAFVALGTSVPGTLLSSQTLHENTFLVRCPFAVKLTPRSAHAFYCENPISLKNYDHYGNVNTSLGIGNGYPCFFISLVFIGACTAVIGDVAGHLGCFINLKDSVNAIAFVALGTSVPGMKSGDFQSSKHPQKSARRKRTDLWNYFFRTLYFTQSDITNLPKSTNGFVFSLHAAQTSVKVGRLSLRPFSSLVCSQLSLEISPHILAVLATLKILSLP